MKTASAVEKKRPSLFTLGLVKGTSLFLGCILLLVSLFSITSVILLAEFGFYTGTFESTQEEVYTHMGKTMAEQTLRDAYNEIQHPYDETYADIEQYDMLITTSLLRRFSTKNVLITITDENNYIIASTYRGEAIHYEGTTSVVLYHDNINDPVERFIHFVIPSEKESSGIFYILDLWLAQVYGQRFLLIATGFISFIAFAVLFVLLLCVAGRHPKEDKPRLNVFDHMPTDIMVALYAGFGFGLTLLLMHVFERWDPVLIVPATLLILISAPLILLFCMSFATRCKCRVLLQNTVIFRLLRVIWWVMCWFWTNALCPLGRTFHQVLGGLPIVWKTATALFVISFIEFMALWFVPTRTKLLLYWLIESFVLAIILLFFALLMHRLKAGGAALAKGDLNHKVDDSRMVGDFREHARHLNSISQGISHAVEERMRSEHFRTELISNVSHDIKTPLTTIISYINLLQQEKFESEAAKKYLETLDRQSIRLKKLMEDLLEVSKASTGNLSIVPTVCELDVFLSQALGEYEDRMEAASLTPVVHIDTPSCVILADGQLLWRVFDNLFSNVVKYAAPDTRVYLDLTQQNEQVTLLFRNISKEELNVPAADLLERFVRGDRSRHTEGSGLGLSIAQSLTELMGGELSLNIDGDLFKVSLTFPLHTTS